MNKQELEPYLRDGKIMMLAYDQGFEHGPTDFDERNYDPNFILDIARKGEFTCTAMGYGLADKFWKGTYEDVPLVVKMNDKTNLGQKAYSVATATVDEVLRLGAGAVGYTIYLGGEYEAEMIKEFAQIRDQAQENGLAVFAWMYPFMTWPSSNDDEREGDIVAYAARVGAELGADVVKIKYPHQEEALPEIIRNAVGTKAVMSGGGKTDTDEEFLSKLQKFMDAGGAGLAVGRNVWQHEDPLSIAQKAYKIIWPE